MKFSLIRSSASVFVFALSVCVIPIDSVYRKITPQNFDHYVNGDSMVVVFFYRSSPSACPKCAAALRAFRKSADYMKSESNLLFSQVDLDEEERIHSEQQAKGAKAPSSSMLMISHRARVVEVPTVKIFPFSVAVIGYDESLKPTEFVKNILKMKTNRLQNIQLSQQTEKDSSEKAQKQPEKSFQKAKKLINKKSPPREKLVRFVSYRKYEYEVRMNNTFVMALVFKLKCEVKKCDDFYETARIFQNDRNIKFIQVDASDNTKFREQFQMEDFPILVWYKSIDKSEAVIYDGEHSVKDLVTFINSFTGFSRRENGQLNSEAGRILPIESTIESHLDDILANRNMLSIRHKIEITIPTEPHLKRYGEYYLSLVREIGNGYPPDDLLERELDFITKQMLKVKSSLQSFEEWTRFRNIIASLIDMVDKRMTTIVKSFKENKKADTQEEVDEPEDIRSLHRNTPKDEL